MCLAHEGVVVLDGAPCPVADDCGHGPTECAAGGGGAFGFRLC